MKEIKIHQTENFEISINELAQDLKIDRAFIEKDYWLCEVLQQMLTKDYGQHLIFKGGTSLTKAHRITNRFSEDIDFVIDQESCKNSEGVASLNHSKKMLEIIQKDVASILPVIDGDKTSKGNRRIAKLDYSPRYHSICIKPTLLLEMYASREKVPCKLMSITSLIHEFFDQSGQNDLIELYGFQPITLKVADYKRTFCDKIFRQNKHGYSPDAFRIVGDKFRDLYDLHMAVQNPECMNFFKSAEFVSMLKEVEQEELMEERQYYEKWAGQPLHGSYFFAHPQEIVKMTNGYEQVMPFIFGEKPGIEEIAHSIGLLVEQIKRYDREKGKVTFETKESTQPQQRQKPKADYSDKKFEAGDIVKFAFNDKVLQTFDDAKIHFAFGVIEHDNGEKCTVKSAVGSREISKKNLNAATEKELTQFETLYHEKEAALK